MWHHEKPFLPKFLIVGPLKDNKKNSAKDQKVFWSVVRMLLDVIKHSGPDIANVT